MKQPTDLPQIIQKLGITSLNPMQQASLENLPTQREIILLSPTGSGKTLAFLLPMISILQQEIRQVQIMIITPTRELTLQIESVWKAMGTGYKSNICYGGHNIHTEIKNLSEPPAILIGTPGRIADHLERESFDTQQIRTIVLDEFDKSLELGFQEQMDFILRQIPNLQQKILVSATALEEIPAFVQLGNPFLLNFIPENDAKTQLSLQLIISPTKDKLQRLFELICTLNSEAAIIFCNHREATERIATYLNEAGIIADFYHGGMDQDDRERALIQFRNKSVNYLVTTDLAARGLDIPEMKHVVHYHLPTKEDEFTHRNGRTARMQASGTAYILLNIEENLPEYVPQLSETILPISANLPEKPLYQTLYISGGKKNKLNKIDIVGFFLQKGKIAKDAIGLIEVKDFQSFVAVKRTIVQQLLQTIKTEKMKGKKYKIELAKKRIIQEK